jgi:uncharacterized protein (DUF433 family)
MARKLKGISIKDAVRDGKPCIYGTGLTLSELLGELAEGYTLSEIAEGYGIEVKRCKAAVEELSKLFNVKSGSMT